MISRPFIKLQICQILCSNHFYRVLDLLFFSGKRNIFSIQNYKTHVKMKYKLETLEMLSQKSLLKIFPSCSKHAKKYRKLMK